MIENQEAHKQAAKKNREEHQGTHKVYKKAQGLGHEDCPPSGNEATQAEVAMLLGDRTTDGPPPGRRRLLGGPCHPPAFARAGLPYGRERIDGILPARFWLT
jgi:hypothetical protein